MKNNHFLKASLLTLVLVFSFLLSWEYHWRSRGFFPTYNDDKVLWAAQRKEVYQPAEQATVFIGGSRIKFDVDLDTWKKLTGENAIQLGVVGTSARLTLQDLARDKKFKGKLVVDVMEAQLFSLDTIRRDKSAREALEYYHHETPAQKASAFLNRILESKLVMLEESKFGLNALLNSWMIPNRPGVMGPPMPPKEFNLTSLDRQSSMSQMFLTDQRIQQQTINFCKKGIITGMAKVPAIKGDTLKAFFDQIKRYTDQIQARGGSVVFVRLPSSNAYLETENRAFPRQVYWDALIAYTKVPAIHYADYPQTARFVCPEWSHLTPTDAVTYTQQLVDILQKEKGWKFPNQPSSTATLPTP
jgi:hypothetical protein